MGNNASFCFCHSFYYWGFELEVFVMWIKVITSSVWVICGLMSILIGMGCDYRNNKLLTEQSTTFEKELAYKQRTQNELEMKLRRAQEDIIKLERQLECREDNEAQN